MSVSKMIFTGEAGLAPADITVQSWLAASSTKVEAMNSRRET